MSEMDLIVQEFLIESYEALDRVDQDLLILEKNPTFKTAWDQIMRTMHSLKGTCGFLGFCNLESVTHAGETLLIKLRDGNILLSSTVVTVLLSLVDATRQMLNSIESVGNDGSDNYQALVDEMNALKEGHSVLTVLDETKQSLPETKAAETKAAETKAAETKAAETKAAETKAAETKAAETRADVLEAVGGELSQPNEHSKVSDSSIRVDVELLDRLMNLVGELVLTRNQMLRFASDIDDSVFSSSTQRLNILTSELQEGVMKTRMQPVGSLWNKLPRVVRDLAMMSGKKVRLEMEGKETELDKTLLEGIKDPLTHIIRNSVDHGLEDSETRIKLGKPAEGVITLRAGHESGYVSVEVSDDGKGMDPERIKAKAIEKGLITLEKSHRMAEREVFNLVFLPGFSTAEQVTKISGRGVGMDVVKTNLERINGSVDISSSIGKGTTLKMKIPLTLAIIPALVVESAEQRYAIPQAHLLELVRIEASEARNKIEFVQDAAVYRLRNMLLPLIDLNNELGVTTSGVGQGLLRKRANGEAVNIVVLQVEDKHFGLVVDHILDSQEIVVKPLGKQLNAIKDYSGAAVMGDGRVALILDVSGFAQRVQVLSDKISNANQTLTDRSSDSGDDTELILTDRHKDQLLLVRVGMNSRVAIPLSRVSRLEEFRVEKVEKSGDVPVIQYRGDILPLFSLQQMFSDFGGSYDSNVEDKQSVNVVVCSDGRRASGLIVEEILDITEEELDIRNTNVRDGVKGSAVIGDKVTDLLDLDNVLTRINLHQGG